MVGTLRALIEPASAMPLLPENDAAVTMLRNHCASPCLSRWRNVEFVVKRVKAAKDNFILGEVDDVMQVRQGQAGKAADISLLG